MLESNYVIIDRTPYEFDTIVFDGAKMTIRDASGRDIEQGSLLLDQSVYAALYCDEVRNVTLVINRDGRQTVETLLWCDGAAYEAGKKNIGDVLAAAGVKMSRQNRKLNRYGEEIAKKLAIGVNIQVIDAVQESAMVKCPDCGMLSPRGTEYCMDCGAELPLE